MPPLANREQFEAAIVADLEPVFVAEYRRAIASPDAIPYGDFQAGLQRSMAKTLARVFQSAGVALSLGFGLFLSAGAFEGTAGQWADGYSRELASQVVQTSRDMAATAVASAGNDQQRLREGLGLVFLSPARLEGIAITEVTTAVSAGEQAVVVPYNDFLGRQNRRQDRLIALWQTSHLPNVCEHCQPLEGRSEAYWGRLYPLGPPAHPRCILPGNLVSLPGFVEAASKAYYVGLCVEVSLANGRKLTVTGNHPILTTKGWVAANILDEGCDVLCAANSEQVSSRVAPHDYNVPAPVEQVFRSFVESPCMVSCTMPVSPEDFHGDARFFDGNVNVVNKLGTLRNRLNSESVEHFSKLDFKRRLIRQRPLLTDSLRDHFGFTQHSSAASGVSIGDNCSAPFVTSALPAVFNRIGYPARNNACHPQSSAKCAPAHSSFRSKRLLGFAPLVSINELIDAGNCDSRLAKRSSTFCSTQLSGFRAGSDVNSHFQKSLSQNAVVDADGARNFLKRFPSDISPSKIINLRRFDWSGHVYNFQCDPYGLYLCNDVIVHNCACALHYVRAAEFERRAA